MRPWIAILLAVALAAIVPELLRNVLACFASIMLESAPYLAGSAALAPIAGRYARSLTAYLGCGCGAGPSARSLPAVLATAALFGPPVALARFCAASAIARYLVQEDHAHAPELLDDLRKLVPAALLAALLAPAAHSIGLGHMPRAGAFTIGALLGAIASPCALGGVALAASLHASAPAAAAGALCTAGIVDIYCVRRRNARADVRDPWAYAMLAAACALVAARGGSALVHPRIAPALACCALFCAVWAWHARRNTAIAPRAIAGCVLAAVIVGAPAPVYRATETTLAGAFAGEHVDFTGVAVHQDGRSALVRYAITCCRADAAPIVLALDRDTAPVRGRWMHASGVFEDAGGALRLHVRSLAAVPPPSDPFVYR